MKLDIFAWSECSGDLWYPGPKARLRLKASADVALYVRSEGYEVLAGVGNSFDVEISCDYEFRAMKPKDCRVFIYGDAVPSFDPVGECYTNADRLPHQSGSVFEVRKALREQQLRHRQMLAEIRQATAALRAASPAPAPDPVSAPSDPASAPPAGAGSE